MQDELIPIKLTTLLRDPGKTKELLDFVKYLGLRLIPQEYNQQLKQAIESNDVFGFIALLKKTVPNCDKYIIDYLQSHSV